MTYLIKGYFYLIYFFSLTIAFPQINLYLTDYSNVDQTNIALQYDCLRISARKIFEQKDFHEIVSLCLTESLAKWNIQSNAMNQNLTFDDLRKENITSEQLYHWSASIDLIEEYEFYLLSNESSMSNRVFYNCTKLRFGGKCQYELLYMPPENFTLNDLIFEFYLTEDNPTSLTCYTHLQCDRGSKSLCLDWTEICDGYVDCLNDQMDERDCWQLEINECGEDEHRCRNGQCISEIFFLDDQQVTECLDRSDGFSYISVLHTEDSRPPIIYFEDIICSERNDLLFTYLTSSCIPTRSQLMENIIIADVPSTLSNTCYFVFYCTFYRHTSISSICEDICSNEICIPIIDEVCPELIIIPSVPLAHSHMYVGYLRQSDYYSLRRIPEYICYNEKLCKDFNYNSSLKLVNNRTCRLTNETSIKFIRTGKYENPLNVQIRALNNQLRHCNTIVYNDFDICNSSLMYRCRNSSKCVSIYYLCDETVDCYYADDEECTLINGKCSPIESDIFFKCPMNNKCISWKRFGDGFCDCPYYEAELCEDETLILCNPNNLDTCGDKAKAHYLKSYILFPTICDGFQELYPILIDGTNYTDESECQHWKCNNTYTRCDGYWNCWNGADEVGCKEYSLINCSLSHHICINPLTFEFMCLPLEKANDGQIDCLGATDEPKRCRLDSFKRSETNFYCNSINNTVCSTTYYLCSSDSLCIGENRDVFCQLSNRQDQWFYCPDSVDDNSSDLVKFICLLPLDSKKQDIVHFSLEQTINKDKEDIITQSSAMEKTFQHDFVCHRGYPLRLWYGYNQTLSDIVCLCLANYYGNFCQYQNQRVTFTLQFQTYSDSRRILFALVILLMDNSTQRTIHSSKQITYVYVQHCRTKFNFYLTYSTRPKLSNTTYYIHIDIYEKLTFGYRGSLYIPLKFPFLPVHRLAYLLNIARDNQSLIIKCPKDQLCVNGRCMKYAERSDNLIFCHCHKGWSGKDCSISYQSICSHDSFAVGKEANNRTICICSVNKWGPRCLLRNTICQSNGNLTCLNNGECILVDDNLISEKKFFCLCPKGFSGDRCELEDAQIIISFDENIILSEVMLVHFIQIDKTGPVKNGSTFQSIPLYKKEIIIRRARPFHIVFAELSNKTYYLINIQKDYNRSIIIRKLITSSDRCDRMSDYFNQTILDQYLIRRIKHYHLPCQNPIPCFYDRDHFCLCNDFGSQRIANCFEFNFTRAHNCFKSSNCQNGGQCLQDDVRCAHTSRCICRKCFYGALCQFTSSLFDLSLDGIIGSHIQPNLSISHQPSIIQTALALIIIIVIIGFLDGILSLITFRSKETRQVGCGYYLLGSTITTLLISILLILKFSILLVAQMSILTNRTFLNIQCYSFDYLLQLCLNMNKLFNVCIAMERAFTIIKGTNFNKNKSKIMAKYVISVLLLILITSTIYDPIHRRLVDDVSNDEQKRLWCIVSYSNGLLQFNQFIHMFYFFVPFFLNIISSLIIIILSTNRRRTVQKEQPYSEIFYEQIQQHRHLLIAPFVLVMLSLPRLIISFVSGCIQSNSSPWLYLIGYLISFIPPMLTFVIFVLPSELYKEEFRKNMKKLRQTIQQRFSCTSSY